MKTIILTTVMSLTVISAALTTNAQIRDKKLALSLQMGGSSAGNWTVRNFFDGLTDTQADATYLGNSGSSLALNMDANMSDNGFLSWGGMISYTSTKADFDMTRIGGNYYNREIGTLKTSGIGLGIRIMAHPIALFEQSGILEKIDAYVGAGYHCTFYDFKDRSYFTGTKGIDWKQFPIFVGGRYLITDWLAATAEFGKYRNQPYSVGLTVLLFD